MRATIANARDLGAVVRRLRQDAGWTQRQLGEALGTSQRYVHELEAGKPKRIDDEYFRILTQLGIRLTADVDLPHRA